MNWPPNPKSWIEFPTECLWYLLPGAVFHIAALVISFIAIFALRRLGWYRPPLLTAMIFQGYLLIAGMIASGIWSCTIWGRLYWSVDYTSDFSVFFPISRKLVDYSWGANYSGGLNQITLTGLNMVWLAFAIGAWLLAFAATRWTGRFRQNRIGEQDVGEQPAISISIS